jgi:hypothetical protein
MTFGLNKQTPAPQPVFHIFLVIVLAAFTFSNTGCRSIEAAQQQSRTLLTDLHKKINAANYTEIYQEADPAFREGTTAADSELLFKGVHDKLGHASSSELQNIRIMATTDGEFITADFKSSFANDSATEAVVWRKTDGAYHLYRYNINSKAFLR